MTTRANDTRWLTAAAHLAVRARPTSFPNPGVGCIIVAEGTVVGRGWTQSGGRPHAEAMALQQASDRARGATAYVTLEPCAHLSERGPACSDALIDAGIARVVIGVEDPDPRTAGQGLARLRTAGIEATFLPSQPAEASLSGYLTKARFSRPHITMKLAVSLDGCIAMRDGRSQWITGEAARAHVHARRAQADIILVGGGTWRADRPRLDVRLAGLDHLSPRRVVLSRGEDLPNVDTISCVSQIAELEALHIYVEAGAGVAASLLAADLVDRIDLYRAPIFIGGGRGAVDDIGLEDLSAAHDRWAVAERRQLGSDSFEAYIRQR